MKKKRSLWSQIIWACCTVSTLSAWASLQSTGNPATTQTGVGAESEAWRLNFVAHQLFNGDRFRCLTIVENGSFC